MHKQDAARYRNLNLPTSVSVRFTFGVHGACAAFAVLALLCQPALAKTPAETAAESPAAAPVHLPLPQLHANAEQITIDMVVRDKKSHPVVGLTPADIAVSDSGIPVQLSDLHLVTGQSGTGVSVALLFDRMTPQSAKAAGETALKLLGMAPPHTSFAVLGLDERMRLFQNYTEDRASLGLATAQALQDTARQEVPEAEKQLLSIEQSGKLMSGANASVEDRAKARIMISALEESTRIIQDQHASADFAGLQALSKVQQGLAGRKIIVFFSEGFRANGSTDSSTRDVVEAANRAGIGIYAVDTSGLKGKTFSP